MTQAVCSRTLPRAPQCRASPQASHDGHQRGHVRHAIADQEDLVDGRLALEQRFDPRGINLLAIRRNDQLLLAASDVPVAFRITGRKKELIVSSNGKKIYPA